MNLGLAGKTVIVTGAASGIGLATTRAFVEQDARVVAADLDAEGLRNIPNGKNLLTVHADVSVALQAEEIVEAAIGLGGGAVDVLINDAGIGYRRTLTETSEEEWDRTFAVNVKGAFLMCRGVIPPMLAAGGGVIVNVASAAALAAVPARAAYCASKAALIGLTKSISVDYAIEGIRANAIAPGVVNTPWVGRVLADAPDPDAAKLEMAGRQLIGRLAEPSEIADAVLFLASERSSFMHGATLVVDGGFAVQ